MTEHERLKKKQISKKEYGELRKKLKTKEAEAEQYLDLLHRLKAEFENYKKRILREQTVFLERAAEEIILKLLPVVDSLEQAVVAAKKNHDAARLVEGVEMVEGQLRDILAKEGLEVINPEGKCFDPTKHEAVAQQENNEHDEDAVVEVMRKGYALKGKVLRPAMVKVCKKVEARRSKDEEEHGAETETE